MTYSTRIALTLILVALATLPVGGQTRTETAQPRVAVVTEQITVVTEQDSRQTREELKNVLERYPPQVSHVLKLDPTLLRNETWLAAYPALATFTASRPEIVHSPAFYLEGISLPVQQSADTPSVRMWNAMMEPVQVVVTIAIIFGVFAWVIRTVIEHKRWSRLSRVQAEVHSKLMDRLTSNEELLAYIQTPAGKKFLESAPIQLDATPRSLSAPVGRILWSVQIGVVTAAAGIGLQLISNTLDREVGAPLFALGILAISIGAGFMTSAFISFVLSRKFGLLEPAEAPASARD